LGGNRRAEISRSNLVLFLINDNEIDYLVEEEDAVQYAKDAAKESGHA
jgi:hypothetical protein